MTCPNCGSTTTQLGPPLDGCHTLVCSDCGALVDIGPMTGPLENQPTIVLTGTLNMISGDTLDGTRLWESESVRRAITDGTARVEWPS